MAPRFQCQVARTRPALIVFIAVIAMHAAMTICRMISSRMSERSLQPPWRKRHGRKGMQLEIAGFFRVIDRAEGTLQDLNMTKQHGGFAELLRCQGAGSLLLAHDV